MAGQEQMTRYRGSAALLLLAALVAAPLPSVAASWFDHDSCPLIIDGDVSLTPELTRIVNGGGEIIITGGHNVLVDGRPLTLTDSQRRLIREYDKELRRTVTGIVDLALEGVEIGLTAVAAVFDALFDAQPPARLQAVMGDIREKIDARVRRDDGAVFLGDEGIDGLDDALAQMEPLIEAAAKDIVQNTLAAAGEAFDSGDYSFVDVIRTFADRMKKFEQAMSQEIGSVAQDLEQKAVRVCERSYALSDAEDKMQDGITELRQIDVVRMSGGAM